MNWYKLSQLYTDITKEEDPDNFTANQYFSIGQNEDTQEESFSWIYINSRLITAQNRTHGAIISPDLDRDDYFRGWFDPIQKLLSIVVPDKIHSRIGASVKHTEEDIPPELIEKLRTKFGNDFTFVVF